MESTANMGMHVRGRFVCETINKRFSHSLHQPSRAHFKLCHQMIFAFSDPSMSTSADFIFFARPLWSLSLSSPNSNQFFVVASMFEAVAFIKRAQFLDTMQLVWPRKLKKNERRPSTIKKLKRTNKFSCDFNA